MDRIIDRSITEPPADTKAVDKLDSESTGKSGKSKDEKGLRSNLADFDESASFVALRNFEGVHYKREDPKKTFVFVLCPVQISVCS